MIKMKTDLCWFRNHHILKYFKCLNNNNVE